MQGENLLRLHSMDVEATKKLNLFSIVFNRSLAFGR